MDDLKQNRLNGGARAKFIASMCSAIVGEQIVRKYLF